MADIRIESVSKNFGTQAALRDVSLDVRDGEFVALLGPSGCGKTTLLRAVAGLDPQSSGRILIGGRDVSNLPPRSRGLAMVFQNYAVFPHLRVRDNIAFGLRHDGCGEGSHRAPGRTRRGVDAYRDAARPLSGTAIRRTAPAGCGGARTRGGTGGAADGRTAVQSRCAVAAGDAGGAEGRAGGGAHHDALCHARSDRGDGTGRSDRHHAGRAHRADGNADGHLSASALDVRGRVHWRIRQ